MKRKYPALDFVRLISEWGDNQWHQALVNAIVNHDLEKLKATLYGLQAGMDMAVKQKLVTEDMCRIFAEMTRQIEVAAKKIFKEKYPCLFDIPCLCPANMDILQNALNKKTRDLEFQAFMKEARF